MYKKLKNSIVEWIKWYFDNHGKGCKAVIGISGGKDSNIDAALCKEAIGADNVCGVLMPNGVQNDIDDARGVAELLGIPHYEINIEPIMLAFYKALEDSGFVPNDIVYNNSPARIRTAVLYAVSGIVRGRVCNNGNLSEVFLGWRTKGGDTVGDFAPLKNLVVRECVGVGHETELPVNYVEKVPEDGMTGKTDEDNFGFAYADVDTLIRDGGIDNAALMQKILTMRDYGMHKEELILSFPYNPIINQKVG